MTAVNRTMTAVKSMLDVKRTGLTHNIKHAVIGLLGSGKEK